MARCASCGADTELYHLGIPICPACINDRDGVQQSEEWEVLENLQAHGEANRSVPEDKAKLVRKQYREASRTPREDEN